MTKRLMVVWLQRFNLAAILLALATSSLPAQKDMGFDNTRPSGQPYLSPEESLRRIKVPPEFEVKVFAAEPDIINPISFSVDERGRLWVLECFEYPKKTPAGRKPRDRIKILEDTTGSGRADKVTVWAEGKDLPIGWDLATGLEVGQGGAFLGAPPHLFFLKDTAGKGKCDHQEILLSGFGSQDTHETLNTLQWGPDGFLYGLQGIFTQSKVNGVQMSAAVWRYDARKRKFDIFAEGTSNPWGLDFDAHGQAILTACVIPHAYHMIPGGVYIRQAGVTSNPYAYGLLREISDHLHHAESGWAHAGALVLQGDQIPELYQGSLLMGSIHGCVVKRDNLEKNGSTFVARHRPDFLVSGDKNFRPINMRWGPDGSIYLIDWHDQNPCHQAHPDSWDMTHGRIYKIQRKGLKPQPAPDLAQKSSAELVELLKNNNPWWHRTALRLLKERGDGSVTGRLRALLLQGSDDVVSLRAMWSLYAVGGLDDLTAAKALGHSSPWIRSWVIRLQGEAGRVSDHVLRRWEEMADNDPAPEVRLQLACSSLRLRGQNPLPLLHRLMARAEDVRDPCIPLMIWLAYEPHVIGHRVVVLDWLKGQATRNRLVKEEILPRIFRRLTASARPEDWEACIAFLGDVQDSELRRQAMQGMEESLRNRQVSPPQIWNKVFRSLITDKDDRVRRLARRLAVDFHDQGELKRSLAIAGDSTQPARDRLEAVHDMAAAHPVEALAVLENLLDKDANLEVRMEACRALAAYPQNEVEGHILAHWKDYPLSVRGEAINLLAGRKEWARALLEAVARKEIAPTDLTNNTILRMRAFRDKNLNQQIETVWGQVRDTPAELYAVINRMRKSLSSGHADPERGSKVFEAQCAKCHKFEGKGHEVGPNLDGASRDMEYLLANILDPNRVVGQPYFVRFVTLKNGRVETGLLAGEDEASLTLKGENDVLKVIQKKEVEEVTVQPKSLMPEGMEKVINEQDFRDLVRYLMVNPFLTEVAVSTPYAKKAYFPKPAEHRILDKDWSRPLVGVQGKIPLPPSGKEGKVSVFVVARIAAVENVRARLDVDATHRVEFASYSQSGEAIAPEITSLNNGDQGSKVDVRKGVNILVFRVTYQGDHEFFQARLLDPNRQIRQMKFEN